MCPPGYTGDGVVGCDEALAQAPGAPFELGVVLCDGELCALDLSRTESSAELTHRLDHEKDPAHARVVRRESPAVGIHGESPAEAGAVDWIVQVHRNRKLFARRLGRASPGCCAS